MQLIADTHVHIYPFYEVDKALGTVLARLSKSGAGMFAPRSSKNAIKVACLTERYDCDVYRQLRDSPPDSVTERFEIIQRQDALLLRDRKGNGEFFLLPGQQIITAENIEVLALSTAERVEEGQSAADTVRSVRNAGGLPVVAWAPGKWFGHRGQVVRDLLDQFSPRELALGDTTLRPVGWLLPMIMRDARKRGFKILYGSDPLPFKGEEVTPGSYHSILSIEHGEANVADSQWSPAAAIRELLDQPWHIRPAGGRGKLLKVLTRLFNNHRAPKPARPRATGA